MLLHVAPADNRSQLRQQWQSIALALNHPEFELTVEEFAALLSVYKLLLAEGEIFDPMVTALIATLERQAAETIDGFEDDVDVADFENDDSDEDKGTDEPPRNDSSAARWAAHLQEAQAAWRDDLEARWRAKEKAADIANAMAMLPTCKEYKQSPRPLVGGFDGDSTDDPNEDASDLWTDN